MISNERKQMFETYIDNALTIKKLKEMLYVPSTKTSWFVMVGERSSKMQEIYRSNEVLCKELFNVLNEEIDEETAEYYLSLIQRFEGERINDIPAIMQLCRPMISFYEAKQNYERLIYLYLCLYQETMILNERKQNGFAVPYSYLYKVISYKDHYKDIKDYHVRKCIFLAYYHLAYTAMIKGCLDIDVSYNYVVEMHNLYNSNVVQELDGDKDDLKELVRKTAYDWLASEQFIDEASASTKEIFIQFAESFHHEELVISDRPMDWNSIVYAAYLHANYLEGRMQKDEMFDRYLSYYLANVDEEVTSEKIDFLLNTPLTLERWVQDESIDPAIREEGVRILKERTMDVWNAHYELGESSYVNEKLNEWCIKLLPYMSEGHDKEDLIFNMVVRRQVTNYTHSQIVAQLAVIIISDILDNKPELIPQDLNLEGDDIISYVSNAARLHDIGKCMIFDVITMQGRPLQDSEFQAIKLHPLYGATLIRNEKSLAKYRDVVVGHHKFYNGEGGYPAEFDNVRSDKRFIIDLISICDSLEAATDYLGRCYRNNKTFEEVMLEFIRDKGVRYNPDLIDYISSNPNLCKRLKLIIGDERLELCYEAYQTHGNENI